MTDEQYSRLLDEFRVQRAELRRLADDQDVMMRTINSLRDELAERIAAGVRRITGQEK